MNRCAQATSALMLFMAAAFHGCCPLLRTHFSPAINECILVSGSKSANPFASTSQCCNDALLSCFVRVCFCCLCHSQCCTAVLSNSYMNDVTCVTVSVRSWKTASSHLTRNRWMPCGQDWKLPQKLTSSSCRRSSRSWSCSSSIVMLNALR